jgi:hypothetical protein
MGGQACIFYGAAEFSRDLGLLVLADAQNLERLQLALADLEAEPVAVPALGEAILAKGHAAHFRCRRADVAGLRIDFMSRYRGGPGFGDLWRRRTTIETDGQTIDLLALEDLVGANKDAAGQGLADADPAGGTELFRPKHIALTGSDRILATRTAHRAVAD